MGHQVLRASWPLWEAVWITVRPEIRFSFLPHPCCVTLGRWPSLSEPQAPQIGMRERSLWV